jgi:AhpD family alkylhydroperoxidase
MTQRLDHQVVLAAGMRALGGVHAYLGKSVLPKALLDLVYLRVSQINGCAYCIDMHSRDALKAGMPVEKLNLVCAWRETGTLFEPKERAALAWAEAVTRIDRTGAPDADYEAVAARFDAQGVADLTLAIGLIGVYNRIAIGFRRLPDGAGPP